MRTVHTLNGLVVIILCTLICTGFLVPNPGKIPPEIKIVEVEVAVPTAPVTIWQLMDAISFVESGNNPDAIGDNGKAVGPFQIQPIMLDDVNRILGKEVFTLKDRYSLTKSRLIFLIYTTHYNCNQDASRIARDWNGGPNGHTKSATLPYYLKVHDALNRSNP